MGGVVVVAAGVFVVVLVPVLAGTSTSICITPVFKED